MLAERSFPPRLHPHLHVQLQQPLVPRSSYERAATQEPTRTTTNDGGRSNRGVADQSSSGQRSGHKEYDSEYQGQLSNTADSVQAMQKSITESDNSVTQATDHAERSLMTASSFSCTRQVCSLKLDQSILAVHQTISSLRLKSTRTGCFTT